MQGLYGQALILELLRTFETRLTIDHYIKK